MRLVLLQGPGEISSRKKLSDLKKGFFENNLVSIESNANLNDVLANLTTPSLFDSEPRLVVLDNPPESWFNKGLRVDGGEEFNLVIWVNKELTEKNEILKFVKVNRGEILSFPESKEVSVFPFLDALAAGEKRSLVELQKLTEAGFDFQYILTMVFYLLRNLAVTPKRAPDFVKNKLSRQRRDFSIERISETYRRLIEIDFKIKSGLLEKEQAYFSLISCFVKLT